MEQQGSNHILIFIEKKTIRLLYIFNLIFKDLLGIRVLLTSSVDEFNNHNGPKISYAHQPLADEFFIAADELLFSRGIEELNIQVENSDDYPQFFMTYHKKSSFHFDPFAASFYLVSRYEEYLPYISDKFGRYNAPESLAFKHGFLEKPVINIWTKALKEKLQMAFPSLRFKDQKFSYKATIDIDAAFAYKNKGFLRVAGGFAKDIFNGDIRNFKQRSRVVFKKETDPFNSFDYIFSLHKRYGLNPIFFVLFANYGTYDKNIPTYNRAFCNIIRRLGDYGEIGIHPSYNSNERPEVLPKEIKELSRVSHCEITKSRQHFLMLKLPFTYQNLIELGITDDYSMGYASAPGFRAGIASPFYFFNLENESITSLKIHPFTYMEGTLKDYMKVSLGEAREKIFSLIDAVKEVDGEFMSLWHNESLGGFKRWTGWPKMYEESLTYALGDIPQNKGIVNPKEQI